MCEKLKKCGLKKKTKLIIYLTGNFEAEARVNNESGVSLFETTLTVGKNGWLLLKSSLSLSKRWS